MSKTVQQLRAAYNRGARWCVIDHYEEPSLGVRGAIISTHRTYALARRAAKKRCVWNDHPIIRELHAVLTTGEYLD